MTREEKDQSLREETAMTRRVRDENLLEEGMKDFFSNTRRVLSDFLIGSYRNLEKALLTLSAGALVLSVTFVHHFEPPPQYLWLLFKISWPALILSILTILGSIRFQRESTSRIESWFEKAHDLYWKNEPIPPLQLSIWTKLVNAMHDCAIGFFIVGIISLTIFCTYNLRLAVQNKMHNISTSQTIEEAIPKSKPDQPTSPKSK